MIFLTAGKTTGKQLSAYIRKAIKHRSCGGIFRVTTSDFCRASGLSRQSLYAYAHGTKPGVEGLAKAAEGFRAWGHPVDLCVAAR